MKTRLATTKSVLPALMLGLLPVGAAESLEIEQQQAVSSSQQLALVLEQNRIPAERVGALRNVFQSTRALAATEQVEFLRAMAAISTSKNEDVRLRTNAIWAMSEIAMLLRQQSGLSDADILRECGFLLEAAADGEENSKVRRMCIKALGDLGVGQGIPIITSILGDESNVDNPDLARSAAISLAILAPDQALGPVSNLLAKTSDPAVFGSAAYALGALRKPEAVAILARNRMRLGDNLSVDNAIEASASVVFDLLENPGRPNVGDAIDATRSMWRQEYKERYTPALLNILENETLELALRQRALTRLVEDAGQLDLPERKRRAALILAQVGEEEVFGEQISQLRAMQNATPLPVVKAQAGEE
ncbi:HEAT repeat domain-containing protein [Haloferula sp. A504]|uniref:HEAT repeat domain-containing protein n=1 Tax=Haloferula sp. A504 TaxID=3373601 RepID=UPI0031CBA06D|nr:HEAT repeat domain-containing protein [Verrucomicrobiaceae bacterium E54]